MTCAELLEQLNTLDEHPRVEAKAASEVGSSIMESVCALANEPGMGGGYLLLGAAYDARSSRYLPVGIPDPDRVQADLASQCASVFNRVIRPEMWSEAVGDGVLIGVFIPELPPGEKPLYFRRKGLPRGAFRRVGSTDQHCNDDDLLVFAQHRQAGSYDGTPVPEASLADMDVIALALYRRERERAHPAAEELLWSDEELLEALGCAMRHEGVLVPTVAGLLLFGTRMALRRLFPMTRVDYIRVPGKEWIPDPEHRFDTVEIRDPLMRTVLRAQAAIMDDFPKAFSLPAGQSQREDRPLIPDRVIREAVVNAVMHRNYRVHGPIQIIRYANRLEIRNPGYSLKPEDQLGEPGSWTRNPKVAAVLHDTRFAESKGSGVRVMRRMMVDANLSPPTFQSNREQDRFAATFYFHHFLGEQDLGWLAHFRELGLSNEEAKALVFVREEGQITNAAFRDLTGTDTLKASSLLRRLRDAGLLEQHDRGAATYYTPTERLLHPAGDPEADQDQLVLPVGARDAGGEDGNAPPGEDGEESGKLGIQSGKLERKSGKLEEESGKLGIQSGELEIPPELAEEVVGLKQWAPQLEVRRIVIRLCAWQPLSAEEIARILGRERSYVAEAYITPLVRSGDLERTIPGSPTDPRQKYRASAQGSGA